MKYPLLFLLLLLSAIAKSQIETFDISSYTSPKGWKRAITENAVQFTKEDAAKGTYCLITLYKSIPGTANSKDNFDMAWASLVKEMVAVSAAPEMQPAETENGWETLSGNAGFESDGNKGIAILVTATGSGKMVNLIILTNTDVYEKEMTTFLESVSLKKPAANNVKPITKPVSIQPNTPLPAKKDGFAFTTTNFDDGWTSTVQEDWVEVTKGNIKALVHFSYKRNTTSSDPDPITNDAWNILVAPRYSNLKNYMVKYVSDYERIHLAAGNLSDNKSGKQVYVVFISQSSKVWIEFISPDKNAFVQAFGIDFDNVSWKSDKAIFEPLLRLSNCNKFAVAASDLTGEWTSNFSGVQQLYYVNTGDYAGMNMNQSSETFQFGSGNTYKWDFLAVNGLAGNGKLSTAKSSGVFKMLSNWQVYFSKIESGPKTYDAYFTCIKGGRILWMNDAKSPGSGRYTGFGKAK